MHEPAAVALTVELEEHHALPGTEAELTVAHRDRLAGVISIDGSCRPQLVPDHEDTDFAALLREVRRRWGIGAVLNTSMNIHGEPLVCSPAEAFDVFVRCGADALAIGRHCFERIGCATEAPIVEGMSVSR